MEGVGVQCSEALFQLWQLYPFTIQGYPLWSSLRAKIKGGFKIVKKNAPSRHDIPSFIARQQADHARQGGRQSQASPLLDPPLKVLLSSGGWGADGGGDPDAPSPSFQAIDIW